MGEKRIIPYTTPWQFDGPVEFNEAVTFSGETITGGTISGATITGSTVSGATITGTTTIAGTVTVASGATLTTPTVLMTADLVTATGATGGVGAVVTAVTPAWHTVTGTSGMGVDLPTGPAGTMHAFRNNMTGPLNLYCVGGTINGTTGTTAYAITATGNRTAFAWCTTATGAWTAAGNT